MCEIKVNNYEVKEMEENDLSEVSRLFSNTFGVEEKSIELTEKSYYNIRNNKDYVSLVIKDSLDSNRIVGCGLGVVNNFYLDTGKPMMVLWGLCIDNHVQRKGLGCMIMTAFERKAMELGCEAIWIFAGMDKTNAHKLYSSMGYEDARKGFIKMIV
jgi:predicted N-acetyltransferase YhbS